MTEEKTADISELIAEIEGAEWWESGDADGNIIVSTAPERLARAYAFQEKAYLLLQAEIVALKFDRDRIEREPVVKTLAWERPPVSEFLQRSYTEIGTYRSWTHHEADGQWFWEYASLIGGKIMNGQGASEAEVQAAAQADYERRILSALASAPDRVEAEPERKTSGGAERQAVQKTPSSGKAPVVTDEIVENLAEFIWEAKGQRHLFEMQKKSGRYTFHNINLRAALEAALASREAT